MATGTHKFSHSQSADEIGATYLDADFLTAKFESSGSRNIEIEVAALDGDMFEVKVSREVPADVPRALKSVVKPWNKMQSHEQWHGPDGGPYVGKIEITTEGVPVTLSTQITVTDNGAGCDVVTVTDAKCSLPLVGKPLEKFVIKEANSTLDKDAAFMDEHA